MNLELFLLNPELASNIRFEIKGSDLLELSATLIRLAKEQGQEQLESDETYLSIGDVCDLVGRTRATVWRWKQKKILVPNQLNLYKKSEVDKFMAKR